VELIDVFIMIMSSDRLANKNLMDNMKLYEQLLGGQVVWANTILVITRQDYNPAKHEEIQQWV